MDFEILNFIQTHLRAPFLDDFFSRITHLGDAGTIWILIAVFLSFTKKYRKAGVGMLIAMLVTYILGDHIIKPLAGRARPFTHRDIELLIPPPGQYSFPSGHTASSFCAAVYLFLYNKKLGIPAFVLAALFAFSSTFSNRCPRRNPTGHCLCSLCFPAVWTQWTRRWSSLKHDLS